MTRRSLSILTALIAVLIISVWLWGPLQQRHRALRQPGDNPSAEQQPRGPTAKTEPEPPQKLEVPPSPATPSSFRISQVDAPSDATGEVKPEQSPYRVIGNGGYPAKILDGKGNVVIEATPNFGIHGFSVSPNGQRVLVLGYPMSLIVESTTNRRIPLASQPPGNNKLGFASWFWVDDDTLLGESGDKIVDRKSGAEGEGNNVAQSRLYLYRISPQQLPKIQLPKDLGAKIFSIAQVNSSGYVHLVHEDPNSTRPPDLGWFKVRPK